MALSILDGTQTATTLSTILSSGQHIPAHTVVSLGTQAITDIVNATSAGLTNTQLRASAVTIGGTVTASITGTVPVSGTFFQTTQPVSLATVPTHGVTLASTTVTVSSLPAISGTVTANGIAYNISEQSFEYITIKNDGDDQRYIPIGPSNANNDNPIAVCGIGGNALPISGTVTANSFNGELTTRFGSITTANTAFATTAVTNTSRKYLMIQNIASTVITAGIGFTPTTTQGIQIGAGAIITFDGNYIPTGAVRILSSVTASNFTVLEA